MRKSSRGISSVAASVTLLALVVGCSGASTPTSAPGQPPQHPWLATRPPIQPLPSRVPLWPPATAAAATAAPATAAPAFPWPATAAPATDSPPYPDPVTFEDAGVNPFVDPLRDRFSTFAMDVDTAAYAVTRRFLEDGHMPDRDSVRLEEFVNSFDYGYVPPADSAFAIHVDGGFTPFNSSRSVLVRVGIQAREIPDAIRAPVSLTFVIDTSGSMDMENRMDLVKGALSLLVSRLRPDDSVALVTFSETASLVLTPTSAAEPDVIYSAIASLSPGGSTNAQAGLELGYDIAALGHRNGANDRVVLASDGVANVGLTDADSILRRIDREVEAGVELVSIGVGMGNFNDVLLEQLANRGNGFYTYINDRTEAERVFGTELVGTLQTVARDARVQVEFRPDTVLRYRLLGYENRGMADQDFTNPYVDAGEVGAGHTVTALYEIEPAWDRAGLLGTVRIRWLDPATNAEQEASRDIDLLALADGFESSSTSFRLAATVAGFAEILRESPYVEHTLADVAAEAWILARLLENRADVAELARLAETASRISGR